MCRNTECTCDVTDLRCRRKKRNPVPKGCWLEGDFHKDTCELPALAFSLTETGPNEDICIALPTVAVPEQRLNPATPANGGVSSDSRLPSLLFVLKQVGCSRRSLQLFTLHLAVQMASTFTSDFVHYFGPGGDFLIISAVIFHLCSWSIADSLPRAREGPPQGLFWQMEFTKMNFHELHQWTWWSYLTNHDPTVAEDGESSTEESTWGRCVCVGDRWVVITWRTQTRATVAS